MIEFLIPGRPACKGSTVSFPYRGRIVTKTDSENLKAWTRAVGIAAIAAGVHILPLGTGVAVTVDYEFERPARARRAFPCVRPDCDKLARALLDSLTGVAYFDDGQVVTLSVTKRYGPATLARVRVGPA